MDIASKLNLFFTSPRGNGEGGITPVRLVALKGLTRMYFQGYMGCIRPEFELSNSEPKNGSLVL